MVNKDFLSKQCRDNASNKPLGHNHDAGQITRLASHRATIMRSRLLLVNDAVIKVQAFILLVVLCEQANWLLISRHRNR